MTAELFVVVMKLEFSIAIVSQPNIKQFHLYSTMTDITYGKQILNALLYQCKSDKIWVEWVDQEKRVTENMINKCVLIKPKKDHLGTIGRLSVFVALQEPLIVKHVCINGLLWLCTVMKVKATFKVTEKVQTNQNKLFPSDNA